MPQKSVKTVIVDPQNLIRDVLSSLLVAYSFHIVGTCAAIRKFDDIKRTTDDVDLTILSGQSVDHALRAADVLFSACPGGKVVFLFDEMSSEEMRRLCSSPIDGCVSLHVSHDVLMRSIEFVVSDNVRIFALDETIPSKGQGQSFRRGEFAAVNRNGVSEGRGQTNGLRLEEDVFRENVSNNSVVLRGPLRRH
jgi:DNA-binding NarL/FixJ family response regulator